MLFCSHKKKKIIKIFKKNREAKQRNTEKKKYQKKEPFYREISILINAYIAAR